MQDCPVPDRRGETWEEVPRPEQQWDPSWEYELERFVVVGEPQLLEEKRDDSSNPMSWWHPVLWLDNLQMPTRGSDEENGMHEAHFASGGYMRLG